MTQHRIIPRGYELQRKKRDGSWESLLITDDFATAQRALQAEIAATADIEPPDPSATDPCINTRELDLLELAKTEVDDATALLDG